jgi:hypothetical protein
MLSTPKAFAVLLFGLVLSVGLTHVSATENMKGGPSDKKDGHGKPEQALQKQGLQLIRGEVVRIDGEHYFVKSPEGKEMSLHVDTTTLKTDEINTGDRIEAKVNEQHHAVSILQAK